MENIITLFTKEHGIYKNMFKFYVILLFIIILYIFTKVDLFNKSIYILIAFIFTIYIINTFVRFNQNNLNDKNKLLHVKLETLQSKIYQYIRYKISTLTTNGQKLNPRNIQMLYEKNKLDALYIDSNMITFLYSILPLYQYNPQEFYLLVKGTNNILKLKHDIERFYIAENDYPENIHEMLQIAIQLKTNCMNNLHNFIYTVPKQNKMYSYIDNILITYNILISRTIKQIHNYHSDYIKLHGINSNTTFIDINTSKSFDPANNRSLIPGKNGLKHSFIDLYP